MLLSTTLPYVESFKYRHVFEAVQLLGKKEDVVRAAGGPRFLCVMLLYYETFLSFFGF